MVKLRVSAVLISFAILTVNLVEPLVQEGLSKFFGTITGVKNVRIPELLNQLCNESQGSNVVMRDACYGCFFRATGQPLGYTLLVAMSNCADIYLNGTDYGHCQQYLGNATSTANSRVSPTTIYCTFLECVRQVNKDTLEALRVKPRTTTGLRLPPHREPSLFYLKLYKQLTKAVCIIREQNTEYNTVRPGAEPIDPRLVKINPNNYTLRECVGEAIRAFPNFNTTDVRLAQLYVNTTACVLAKTRCAHMNPITGEFQEDDIANKLHIPTINAVLVNTDYDINIVQLPFHYASIDVCAKYRNYEQASWPGVVC